MRSGTKFSSVFILLIVLLCSQAERPQAALTGQSQDKDTQTIYIEDDIERLPEILSAPLPAYSKMARKNKIEGVVLLQVVLHSSGKVTKIIPLKELPYGLTENSLAAARKIKFRVGTINGKAVSVYQKLEYTFSLSGGVCVNTAPDQ